MFGIGITELVIILIPAVLVIIPFWRIFTKIGFSGWLSLTLLIPLVNVIVLYYLAFAAWPIHRQDKRQNSAS